MKHIDLTDKMPGNFDLYFGGDIHIGNSALEEILIKKLIKKVKRHKNGYYSSGGDQLECISVDDKRFSLDTHAGKAARIDAQRDYFIELFSPIADKFLWILEGNHERKYKNIFNVTNDIANALDCESANGVLAKILFPNFRVMDWHGNGTIRSGALDARQREINEGFAIKKKLMRLPGNDCELSVMHHIHRMRIVPPSNALNIISDPRVNELKAIYQEPAKIYVNGDKKLYRLSEDDRWFCSTGSVLRGYVEGECTYVEEVGYEATELGYIKMTVKNDKIYKIEKCIL
jgi:hypothetical protein